MVDNYENKLEHEKTEYKTVLELAQSQIERDALSKIKEDLDLRDFDSLWSIVGILQMYMRTVGEFNSSMKDSVYDAVKTFGDNGGIIRTTDEAATGFSSVNYFFLAAAMLLFGSVTFVAGALLSGTAPAWLTGASPVGSGFERAAYLLLNAPAGWILCLILSVPAFFYIRTYFSFFRLARERKEKALNFLILIVLICLVFLALTVFIKIMFH